MKNWENIDYQAISKAHIRHGTLFIRFANNDEVSIALQSLLPFVNEKVIEKIHDEDVLVKPYEIEIDLNTEKKFIPWDKIRVLTDKEFSRHMSELAEEQAKLVGIKIKRLREKKGIKSNDLAARSGITAQTISRIEKGHQDIGFTTLRKLLASMGYSLKDLANEEVELENERAELKTFPALLKKLSKLGIDPNFVKKRIIPPGIQEDLNDLQDDQPDLLLDEAATYLSAIYNWSVADIWNKSDLNLDQSTANLVLLKKPSNANSSYIKAYMPYATFLAQTALKAKNKNKSKNWPRDIEEFRQTLEGEYGGINLGSILSYAWDMGIAIVPLRDSGVFHGAAWNIKGEHVIVLKQQVISHAKWIFDLLHEIYHVLVHLKNEADPIVEAAEISPISKDEDPKEIEANSFASQILFGGNAEAYAQEAVKLARGKTEYLKSAVEEVATKHGIRVDSLANYVAYRLSFQGTQWWPTAESLQQKQPEPYLIAKDFLLDNIDLKKLGSLDYDVLSNALKV